MPICVSKNECYNKGGPVCGIPEPLICKNTEGVSPGRGTTEMWWGPKMWGIPNAGKTTVQNPCKTRSTKVLLFCILWGSGGLVFWIFLFAP